MLWGGATIYWALVTILFGTSPNQHPKGIAFDFY